MQKVFQNQDCTGFETLKLMKKLKISRKVFRAFALALSKPKVAKIF